MLSLCDNIPSCYQGRAVFSAYVVITLHEKDDGLQIGAYDSEACREQKLTLNWDELAQRLGEEPPSGPDANDEVLNVVVATLRSVRFILAVVISPG